MKRSAMIWMLAAITVAAIAQEKQNWLEPTQFNADNFSNPPLKYAPMTRWWWPGNDVKASELRREVNLFADNHFGGVEIQPLGLVFPVTSQEQGARIMSFDSPEYYQNIDAVMQEAQKRGLIVDITVGSGWPSGGEHITEAESNLTLRYAVTDIPQGNTSRIELPTIGNDHRPNAQLVALLAAKVEKEANGTLFLNQQSVKDITVSVKEGTFTYSPQESGYKAIAVWAMSAMEQPMLMAKPNAGMVVNHFDAKAIRKNYEYYFGERTCFPQYYGQPLRALFNDSYEFKVDRHFSDDFISTFKTKRGYDPTLTLPANLWDGYNNMYARSAAPDKQPAFAFGPEDWRMRYDYDLTLSDVLRQQFMATSTAWTNQRGLLHRSQGYGFHMDIMGVAGSIDIPEGETMVFNYGSEAGYKLITSGAHLYNKPIVTSESAVYIGRALLTTPQKLKMVIDKILSAGVNQVIWHGSPYYYKADGQAPEGWRPYFLGMYGINFSSEIYEGNEFWSKMSDVNLYAQRAQYLLRSGKPKADVLIYYPFLNFSDETYNPKELLVKGYIPGVEPTTDISSHPNAYSNTACTEWLNEIYPLIDELNRQGIIWDWINDESLQAATLEADKQLNIRGNLYQGLVLFNLPYIQLNSAQHLQNLVSQGAQVLTIGQLARIQPSYNDYALQDQLTAQAMQAITAVPSATAVTTVEEAALWLSKLNIPLRSNDGKDIVKQIRREMDNGDLAQFYYNESEKWTPLQVQVDKNYPYAYWMDAATGTITPAQLKKGILSYALPPLSTIFLYVSKQQLSIGNCQLSIRNNSPVFDPQKAKIVFENDTWDVEVVGVAYKNMKAQDWREIDVLKYQDAEGHYDMTIKLPKFNKKARYFLDLGQVYYTASLRINGHEVGERLWKPYLFDVTPYLHAGENHISVNVTPSRYNSLVKRGIDGEDAYSCLKESTLVSEGMTGKLTLYEQ